jgi:TPR repeat protein
MSSEMSGQPSRVAVLLLSIGLILGAWFLGWTQDRGDRDSPSFTNSEEPFLTGIKHLQAGDMATAAQWFRRAADLGHAKAHRVQDILEKNERIRSLP